MNAPASTENGRLLVVGSMALDDLELPTENAKDVVGGSATYFAYAASLFGPVQAVAVVGDDFPMHALDDLAKHGVDLDGVEHAPGKTFRWVGRYSSDLSSRASLDTQLNVFADFQPKLPASHQAAPFVMLGNIHPTLQLDVLDQTLAPKFVAADTMNFWIEGEREALGKVLARVDALVINDEELRQLAGEHNIRRAAARVLAMGPKRLIVKRGEYGAMLFDAEGIFYVPSFPLDTEIDPTGAGDSFAGALMGYLARDGVISHAALRRALVMAATVASFTVQGVGARELAGLNQNAVEERANALRNLMRAE